MHADNLAENRKEWHGTLKSYMVGFIASVILTSISFYLVVTKPFSVETIIFTIAGLALVQAIFQLLYFLHVGKEKKPRWETGVFYFMVLVLVIIVIGSLWIMYDLDHRVMTNMSEDIFKEEIFHD